MLYLKSIVLLIIISQPIQACRLWAVCAKFDKTFSTMSEVERLEVESQLGEFYIQSKSMQNGWSLMCYSDLQEGPIEPLYRSDSPASNDSLLYWSTVNSLLNFDQGRIGIGHLRLATSGSNEIPNPHPWIFYSQEKSYSLIHNGTLDKQLVHDLITDNGADMSWLDTHPPNTFGSGDWGGDGWPSVVDSELILLYVMKMVELTGDMYEGFQIALNNLIQAGASSFQLNLIFSDGDVIMAFGGGSYALHFLESEEYFAVMTQPPQDDDGQWDHIVAQELIVIDGDNISRHPDFITIVLDDNHQTFIPSYFHMEPVYPNPFNSSVQFVLNGTTIAPIKVSVYSISGNKVDEFNVSSISNEKRIVGWSPPTNLSSGTYFINANSSNLVHTRKILFIK